VFDRSGQVVGISAAFLTAGNDTGSVGLGLVIPSNDARLVVNRLSDDGYDSLGWNGVHVQSVTPDMAAATGLLMQVASIVAGGSGLAGPGRCHLDG
jgi:S1-C subfamily serine protease